MQDLVCKNIQLTYGTLFWKPKICVSQTLNKLQIKLANQIKGHINLLLLYWGFYFLIPSTVTAKNVLIDSNVYFRIPLTQLLIQPFVQKDSQVIINVV